MINSPGYSNPASLGHSYIYTETDSSQQNQRRTQNTFEIRKQSTTSTHNESQYI